jgi:hypothetical protein
MTVALVAAVAFTLGMAAGWVLAAVLIDHPRRIDLPGPSTVGGPPRRRRAARPWQ